MSNIQIFNYKNNSEVRVIEQDGEPWFVARDVCDVLGLTDTNKAVNNLDDDEKLIRKIFVAGQNRDVITISESRLYTLIMRSNKPEAKQFRKWVTGEVLPQIRKTGFYATQQKVEEIIADPDSFIKVLTAPKEERAKVQTLTAQAEENRPKVIFAEAVDASKDSILIGNLAKILRQNGIQVGQNRLFAWLREHGYLMSCYGERWNMPKQCYIDKGLFEIKKSVVNNPDGSTKVNHTPKVTGKGQIYFVDGFLSGHFQI